MQTSLDAWAADPQDEQTRTKLLVARPRLEIVVNRMLYTSQNAFEGRVTDRISSSSALANLLTSASMILIALVILTAYSIFQFLMARWRAEDALRASERRLRAILDTIPDTFFRVKRDGTYTDFKPAKDLEPYMSSEQFLGNKVGDIFPARACHSQYADN